VRRKKAFTLVEIITVVAIVGLLIAIIVPTISKARQQTRRTVCAANLRQVGTAFISYMQYNRDRMPHISKTPSIDPFPLEETVWLANVLKRHLKGHLKVLECPDDRPGKTNRNAPNTGKSFFQSERSSYEYRVRLAGLSPKEFYKAMGPPWRNNTDPVPSNTVWIARDYDNFHIKNFIRPEGRKFIDPEQQKIPVGARRYVYIDSHVTDYEN